MPCTSRFRVVTAEGLPLWKGQRHPTGEEPMIRWYLSAYPGRPLRIERWEERRLRLIEGWMPGWVEHGTMGDPDDEAVLAL